MRQFEETIQLCEALASEKVKPGSSLTVGCMLSRCNVLCRGVDESDGARCCCCAQLPKLLLYS